MSFPRGPAGLRDRRRASYGGLAPLRPAGLGSIGPQQPRSLPRRMLAKGSAARHMDWILLAAVLGLALIGSLLVWSATQPALLQAGSDPRAYLKKQLLNIALGLIFMLITSTLDYRRLRLYAPVVYGVSCLGLIAVLSPVGSTVNGAHSWISLPAGFQLEPSEYAKLGLILLTAVILAGHRQGQGQGQARPGPRAVALAVACAALPLVLVALQPDLGVVILMTAIAVGMIALSGIRLGWLAGFAAAGLAVAVAAVNLHLLKAYQLNRLTSFLNPSADPRGSGYSADQSKIAIGSGGLFGRGLFHGPLTAGNFVPEQHTDFIFSVAGEELGFAGAAVIILLLAVVFLRALRIAAHADDQFGMLVAAGIAIWFAVQAFVNIGMTIGIMPVTGLPLPFVSYGGSAMFADMIAIGALHSVRRHMSLFSD